MAVEQLIEQAVAGEGTKRLVYINYDAGAYIAS